MAAFIDYTYYIGTFKGELIPDDLFDRFALRATEEVDYHTFELASETITADSDDALIDKIRMATCAVAEELYVMDTQASGVPGSVSSERVGDYSVNYATSSDSVLPRSSKALNAMRRYLASSGLLYRGLA